jgi:dienelactone hydrolase
VIEIRDVEYEADGTPMVGLFATPAGRSGLPAVLIAHGAPGLDDFARTRPEQFAAEGFAALALDYHGGGRALDDPDERAARMNTIGSDPELLRRLGSAGLAALLAQPEVDQQRVAAVGYCFGAVVAMELARTGADLRAVVGFHPGLLSLRPEDSRRIAGQVLMCVGAEDPLVPPGDRALFEEEMRTARVAWQLHVYGGVKHRFTDPDAARAGSPAMEYHQAASQRAWRSMLDLFADTLG